MGPDQGWLRRDTTKCRTAAGKNGRRLNRACTGLGVAALPCRQKAAGVEWRGRGGSGSMAVPPPGPAGSSCRAMSSAHLCSFCNQPKRCCKAQSRLASSIAADRSWVGRSTNSRA